MDVILFLKGQILLQSDSTWTFKISIIKFIMMITDVVYFLKADIGTGLEVDRAQF